MVRIRLSRKLRIDGLTLLSKHVDFLSVGELVVPGNIYLYQEKNIFYHEMDENLY